MLYLTTVAWCILSPYAFVINAEAWVVVHATRGQADPLLLGLCAALGQTLGYTSVYFFAARIVRRWRRLRERVDAFDARRFTASAMLTLIGGSTISAPPYVVVAASAGLVKYSLPRFVLVTLLGRSLRFVLLAHFPFLLDKLSAIF